MAVFTYKALDENSALIQGTISADNPRTARDLLRNRGLLVESVVTQREATTSLWWPRRRRGRYGAKRVAMIRELSTLLSAGIPLLEALDSQAKQHTGNFQTSLLLLRDRVAAGSMLADGMREQPEIYDPLSVHMVEVGENSGTLDKVLDQLANFSERYLQLKDRVTNALFYPVVVFLLSMGVGMFLMTVVVPMLLDNLLEAGKTIPWPTRVLKAMSDALRAHGLEMIAVAAVLVTGILLALRTETGRRFWHRLLLKLPVLGTMARKQEIARMALIVSTLLKSGIVLVHSLEIAGRATKNVILQEALAAGRSAIQTGQEIGHALESTQEFPPTVVQLEGITLKQFAQLAVYLRKSDASLGQLHITALRIDTPYRQNQQQASEERWNVEFTLIYFVYSPKSSNSRAR